MGTSGDRRQSAPRTLQFVLFEELRSAEPSGREVRDLRFRAIDFGTDDGLLRVVRIRGVPPNILAMLVISEAEKEAFEICTQRDAVGRACTAGDMLVAMYGLDRQDGLQVPASEFTRPVRAIQAVVHLRIQAVGLLFTDCVGVSVDACHDTAPSHVGRVESHLPATPISTKCDSTHRQ